MNKKKANFIVAGIIMSLVVTVSGCGGNQSSVSNKNTETQKESVNTNTEKDTEKETETQNAGTEGTQTTETEPYVPWYEKEWEDVVASGLDGAKEFDEAFVSEKADISKWFADYNGESIQRIAGSQMSGITTSDDIVYYNTEETDIQKIVKTMLTEIVEPYKEPSEERAYTVIRYELDEKQPIVQISENVWVLHTISGYYEYEGTCMGTMEEHLEFETEPKDGMIRFYGQGGDCVFQFIILKDGNVYRIQRAVDMGYHVGV